MGLSSETRERLDRMNQQEKKNRRCSKCGRPVMYPAAYCSQCRNEINRRYNEQIKKTG